MMFDELFSMRYDDVVDDDALYAMHTSAHVHTNVYKFAGNISVIHKSGTTDIWDEYATAHT